MQPAVTPHRRARRTALYAHEATWSARDGQDVVISVRWHRARSIACRHRCRAGKNRGTRAAWIPEPEIASGAGYRSGYDSADANFQKIGVDLTRG
jgi:hypothetical protein